MRPLVIFAALCTVLPASAHFGEPVVTGLRIRVDDPRDWMAISNLGPLLSDDGGTTFRWVCHNAITDRPHFDFDYLWLPDGSILGAVGEMRRSRDGGCTWEALPGFEGFNMTTLAQHPVERSLILASSEENNAQDAVFRSRDGGDTFTLILERWAFFFDAIALAPSDPERLYISGFDLSGVAALYRSDDGGDTFTELPFVLPAPGGFRVLGVHPTEPDTLYAAFLGRPEGLIYRSTDAGLTFSPILDVSDGANSMVFDDDEPRRLWIATGTHIYRSDDGGDTFTRLSAPNKNACVAQEGRLFACGDHNTDDFSLAITGDDGDTWASVFSLDRLSGPLSCPAGTPVRTICPDLWAPILDEFAEAASDTSLADDDVALTEDIAGQGGDLDGRVVTDGCACALRPAPRSRSQNQSAAAVALLGGFLLLRRRRRRRPAALRGEGDASLCTLRAR